MLFNPARLIGVLACLAAASCGDSSQLTGTFIAVSAPEQVQLGEAYVGDRVVHTLELRATGTGHTTVSAVGSDHADLTQAPSAPFTIVSSGTPVEITWQVRSPGHLQATLTFQVEDEMWTVEVRGQARELPNCDDDNACTDDSFDRAAARCRHAEHERECDDGSACTNADRCHAGQCLGQAVQCNDNDVCTLDLCDPADGCRFE